MGSSNGDFTPTFPSQLRYLLQWFNEWSEMQRYDFLPILLSKFTNINPVNSIIPSIENLNTEDETNKKPLSLFQCRIKLFNDWIINWSDNEKEEFINSIKNIDSEFIQKYEQEILSNSNSNDKVILNNNNEIETVKEEIHNGDHIKQEENVDVEIEDNII